MVGFGEKYALRHKTGRGRGLLFVAMADGGRSEGCWTYHLQQPVVVIQTVPHSFLMSVAAGPRRFSEDGFKTKMLQ